ncbi:MAG: S8 family serine peptidase [Anaerolineales bacterium]|uniref:S8 family serine peptidase n=1 Tax=Promineifilum sp. TaxID=2664178 RepID=UPI001D8519E5|nr:S8 family serine peptidase [Anaerolineales bacterium]MCO5180979.1 S8 family serine peptidase [Promineifilum sp.]
MNNTPPPPSARSTEGNASLWLVVLLAAAVGGLLFILYPAVWLAEQIALVSGGVFGRETWVVTQASAAAVVLLISLPAVALSKSPRVRAVFQTWTLAGVFGLVALPVQLVGPGAAQSAALAQIAALLVYLALLWLLARRGKPRAPTSRGAWWPAALVAALIVWPWVIWGAMGSWLDTFLNLAAALLFGLAAGLTLRTYLWPHMDRQGDSAPLPFFIAGLVTGLTLMIMGAAFGHNGQQLVLIFLLAGSGWLVVAVTRWGENARPATWRPVWLLIGLLVAAPLLFIDPEELSLILNLGSRDVGYYAFLATLIGAGLALLLGIILWLAKGRAPGSRPLAALLTAAALLGLTAAYLFAGQPGRYGERLYVILTDQADLSAAAAIADPIERRTYVYETMTAHATSTQAGIRRALDTVNIDYRSYYLDNALEIDAGPLVRLWLASRPEVDRILISPELRPLPETPPPARGTAEPPSDPQWNLVDVGAPQVWAEFGARGQGIVIGQSDSGVDGTHPELRQQYRGNQTGGPAGDVYNWFDPWNGTLSPTDIGGHGTHTLGTVLGRSVGVAPEATWIGCVNLARNLGNPPRYLDCLQFMLAPFPPAGDPAVDGRPELGANVLNNSWGCPEIEGCDAGALLPAVRALRAAGVFVVASAGNDGAACASITAPISLYDEVFTVGAVDSDGQIAPFSSRGPVQVDSSNRIKPDVVAPGVDVLSSFPGGTYAYSDGTSMAGPHVAGVVALLWSADPTLIGDVDRTERILTETARPLGDDLPDALLCGDAAGVPNNVFGYGLIDAYAAIVRATR